MNDAHQPALVVGVGASAGGLEAFKQLLAALPHDSGMTFLLVQHLDPSHRSLLSELLAACTNMSVRDADHGALLERDTVYIIRPDTALAVQEGRIELSPRKSYQGARLPVDHLFRSLAKQYGQRAVGIVLSGAGSDGSAGVRDIKAEGGLVLAQAPDTSGQRGMPQSAIDTGAVDLVLRIPDMPAALNRFAAMPPMPRLETVLEALPEGEPERLGRLGEQDIARLAAVLDAQSGFDLRVYKPETIERRVLRRLALSGFDAIEPYLDHLRANVSEQQTLIRDLLISVTEFFRDGNAFRALRELVIDPMVAASSPGATLRAWVPACATGEEAYSIAIEFLESLASQNKRLSLQVFATDVDFDALAFARAGIYPASIADQVSERRLKDHFEPVDGKGYQVRRALRDVVSFAMHDLTKDPPFSRMNLVSCRNVLIYLTTKSQRHVLKVLHFAMEREGHLFLSTSESIGPQRELFTTVSNTQRIYRKVGASQAISVPRSRFKVLSDADGLAKPPPRAVGGGAPRGEGDVARRAVLDAIAPPTLVVTGDGTIVFAHGDLSPYMQLPQGDHPRFELGSVLREAYAIRVRGVLYKCRREGTPQFAASSPDGGRRRVQIAARPAPSLGSDAVVLTFEELPPAADPTAATRPSAPEHEAMVEHLDKELQATREDLRSTLEQLETANEELRSSSEESMSMNEELQSANEELEATTEELRSLNEELTTVNSQLREKIEPAEQAHDDLNNFFASTKIATLFLDERQFIKRFTPSARVLLGLAPSDTGRGVADIARELLQHDLATEAKEVLDNLTAISRDIQIADGRWITRQVLPYRTESRRIEGVVVNFNDVTERREATAVAARDARRLKLAWETAQGGIFEHRISLDESTYVSEAWAQVLGYGRNELPHYSELLRWLSQQVHPEDRERFDRTHSDFSEGRTDRFSITVRIRHHAGQWIWVRKVANVVERDHRGLPRQLLRMMMNITDFKETEAALKESEVRFREMVDGLPLVVWVHDERGEQQMVNQTLCDFFGVTREDMKGGRWKTLVHPDDAEAYAREFHASLAERRAFHAEVRVRHADGRWHWVESWGKPRFGPNNEFHGIVGASADITDRHLLQAAMRESEDRFRTLADNVSQLAWMTRGDGWIVWYNSRWYEYTGTTLEQMQGWGWRTVHHPDHVARVERKFREYVARGQAWEDTFPLRGASGEYRWFLSRAVPIRGADGTVVRWFGTNTDVTQLREIEEKLREADRQKDNFLAMLSHELRNPLAAIQSTAEVLKSGKAEGAVLAGAHQILERQAAHMARLVDGLLDIARIVRGRIQLDNEVLDLVPLCRSAVAEALALPRAKAVHLRPDMPSESLWVRGDRVRLAQILNNLISNAHKFTPEGGHIDVRARRDDHKAVVTVRDTGVGIEAELLPHVFEIFLQGRQPVDRSQGGLGLGLSLVKTLTELHGGTVAASSEGAGKGAQFTLSLPMAEPPASQALEVLSPIVAGALQIVVVEDNRDAGESLRWVLELSGHRVSLAADGVDGISRIRGLHPDVVICDIGLPGGKSGYDVARDVRSDPELADVRLVALSGYGREEDVRQSLEAGFDHHLTKPADIAALEQIFATVRGNQPSRGAGFGQTE
ncbi:MAG: chemotaxis protein CheB [Lautropia sp.]